jgi:hypothetical protein
MMMYLETGTRSDSIPAYATTIPLNDHQRRRVTRRAVVVRFAVPGFQLRASSEFFVSAISHPGTLRLVPTPGKTLADIHGRPMIEHVYRRAAAARSIASVIVATDDERSRAVEAFGGVARMTSPGHQSGTDRIAEVASLQAAPSSTSGRRTAD